VFDQYTHRSQRVVVKVKQSYNKGAGLWKAHGKYLERDTARFGDGFSRDSEKIDIPTTLNVWQEAGDEKLHKIILSPESPESLDLQSYTREVMAKVQSDLGKELDWVAITHTNTDNSHVHIALRGIDSRGQRLDIESYLGINLRIRSQELATNKIGPRLYPEILEKRQQELYAKRLTDVDRILLLKAKDWVVELNFSNSLDWKREQNRSQEHSRLIFLTEIGLAERLSENRWRLSNDIRERLKRLSLCDQLVKEQVPGWQFLKTLERIGIERKTLAVGEKLIGRVIASNIRDPFGDREYILIDASDGKTYQLNQPKVASEGRLKDGEVVLLERRKVEIVDKQSAEKTTREFTSVRTMLNWEHSFEIKCDSIETLNNKINNDPKFPSSSFATKWQDERRKRLSELEALGVQLSHVKWQSELGEIHFKQIDQDYVQWNPRDAANQSIKIVGEVIAANEKQLLVKNIKDGLSRGVNLKDVGLNWPPGLGEVVSISVKSIPKLEITNIDKKIAGLLSFRNSFEPHELTEQERKFITARANSWVKWKLLEQDLDGAYRVAGDSQALSKELLLKKMEQTLSAVRLSLHVQVRKQPAWIKRLDQDSISADSERFTTLDRLLADIGESLATTDNWLAKALTWRRELWKGRGVEINEHFERRAREWLVEKISPSILRTGESVTGKVVNLSVNNERYFAVDSSDGLLRHFRITDRIREQIESSMLEVGDVVTLTGRSFIKKAGTNLQHSINYLETTRLCQWQSSEELLKAAIKGEIQLDIAVESDSFALTWKEAVQKRRESLKTLFGLEIRNTKLRANEELIGKVIDFSINDQTKILIEGRDGRLHLITQGRSIRKAIKEQKIDLGDVIILRGREFEVNAKRVVYTEAKKLSSWSTSIQLDKFSLGDDLDAAKKDKELFRSTFARKWITEAEKRKWYLVSRDITFDSLSAEGETNERKHEINREFFEIKLGYPASGIVQEINFGENGAKPQYLILATSNDNILYIKASHGIARAIVDGRIQESDKVTLSTKEFTKNGQLLYYTEINQPEIRKRTLQNGEVLLCKLLEREIHKESYLLVDSPEGKTLLRVSRAIKNQIKSGELRVGDVILFSVREIVRTDLGDQKVSELRATPLCNWKRSEYLDRAAVRAIQSETTNDQIPLPLNSFSNKWQEAVSKRANRLKENGVGLTEDWEAQLRKLREVERQELIRRTPRLNDIQSHDLRDLPRLEVLFNEAANKGVIIRSEANALNFIAAAVKAQNARGNDTRIFEEIVKRNDWKKINQVEEVRARNLLINYRARFDNAFATTASEDSSKREIKENQRERDDAGRSL
jgi:type IV secretory pathway VirD2 relaxase